MTYALGRIRGRRTLQTGDLFPSAAWTGISSIDEPALQVNPGVTDLADSAVTHTVYMPSSYSLEVPAPLVILFHGYNGIGDWPRVVPGRGRRLRTRSPPWIGSSTSRGANAGGWWSSRCGQPLACSLWA